MENGILHHFIEIDKFGNEPALSIKDGNGEWRTYTWNDFYQYVLDIMKKEEFE